MTDGQTGKSDFIGRCPTDIINISINFKGLWTAVMSVVKFASNIFLLLSTSGPTATTTVMSVVNIFPEQHRLY